MQDGISLEFVDRLVAKFMISLEDAQADISKVKDEFYSLLQYVIHFVSLATLYYGACGGECLKYLHLVRKRHSFSS